MINHRRRSPGKGLFPGYSGILFSLCFLWALFLFTNISVAQEKPETVQVTLSLENSILDLMPLGWRLYDKIEIYSPQDMYEKINGSAEMYLAYDVSSMNFVSLETEKDEGGKYIDIFIFDMNSSLNAFGVYSIGRPSDVKKAGIGQGSYIQDSGCYFWKGQYYIKIDVSEDSPNMESTVLTMAQKLSELIPDRGEQPWGQKIFPENGRIKYSLKYFHTDLMGLDFISNTFIAKYDFSDMEVMVFVSRTESQDEAQKSLTMYREYVREFGKGFTQKEREDRKILLAELSQGYDAITYQKGYLIGVLSVPTAEKAVDGLLLFLKMIEPNIAHVIN